MRKHSIIFQKTAKRRKSILFSMLLTLFLLTLEPAIAQTRTFTNVSYKKNFWPSPILDIFLPDSSSTKKFPVLIIIHGGGWVEGDKTLETIYYMQRLKSELLKNGFAIISINYTLVGKDNHLPVPIQDSKDAIRWVRAHTDEYRLDTSNIGLWGGSAGGHLALIAAYTTDEAFVGSPELSPHSARVSYVIDNFGPTNLNSLFRMNIGWFPTFIAKIFYPEIYRIRERLVFAMTGYAIKKDKKKIKEVNEFNSPINYVNRNAVPTIIFHGPSDKVVPIAQSEQLKTALDNSSVVNEFITVKDGDHGFNNISNEKINQLIEQTIIWIKKQVK